jgi:hypothetical protein
MMRGHPGRTFVVGCPRSGTTLLQSLLAAHPAIVSCPETFFFLRVMPSGRLARRSGVASHAATTALEQLRELGVPAPDPLPHRRSVRAFARAFTAGMDALATAAGAEGWLEKTPAHLHVLRPIERSVPDARVVHVIRSGAPTVASLYEVTNQHPDAWGGRRSLDTCIRRWNDDIDRSLRWVGRPGHCFVSYERLVDRPAEVVASVFETMGLDGETGVAEAIEGFGRVADSVSRSAPWKATVGGPITDRNDVKVACALTEAERADVERRVRPTSWLDDRFPFV